MRLNWMTSVLFFLRICQAFVYPKLMWKSNMLNGRNIIDGGFRKGNALVLSKNQARLWMTDGAGGLHLVQLHEGGTKYHTLFQPTSRNDRMTESRSSVALYERSGSTFAVYAVLDIPVGDNNNVQSRVICVNENNALLWTTLLDGAIIGNPQISSNGEHVIVLHNLPSDGVVSVLSVLENGAIVSQKNGNFLSPFGPPELVTVDNEDVIYWGESNKGGYGNYGKVLHMKVEKPFDIHADFLVDSSTLVAPTLSADGKTMWLGGKDAMVYSWRLSQHRGRAWKRQLPVSRRNSTFPIINQIEAHGSRLFVASATNSFHCLNADNGEILWSATSGPSIYLTSARYTSNRNVVYSIQHLTGKVIQYQGETGDVLWHFDCVNVTGSANCMDSVEAEPSLSADGTMLYYGDIYGTVYALAVSDVSETEPPSTHPSDVPVTLPPTFPSLQPSPDRSQKPSMVPLSAISNTSVPSFTPSFVFSPVDKITQHPSQIPSKTSIPQVIPTSSLAPSNATSHVPLTTQPTTLSPTDELPRFTLAPKDTQEQMDVINHQTPIPSSGILLITYPIPCVLLSFALEFFII